MDLAILSGIYKNPDKTDPNYARLTVLYNSSCRVDSKPGINPFETTEAIVQRYFNIIKGGRHQNGSKLTLPTNKSAKSSITRTVYFYYMIPQLLTYFVLLALLTLFIKSTIEPHLSPVLLILHLCLSFCLGSVKHRALNSSSALATASNASCRRGSINCKSEI